MMSLPDVVTDVRLEKERELRWRGRRRASPARPAVFRHAPYLLAMLPAALLLLLFFVVPVAWALYTSLTDRALLGFGAQETRFIGLANYRRLFEYVEFPRIVRNSIVFVLGAAVVGQTGGGLLLALLLRYADRQRIRLGQLGFAAVIIAWITPPLVAGSMWGELLDAYGLVNRLSMAVGLGRLDLLAQHPMLSVILAEAWRGAGLPMILLLAGLQMIPKSVYEAALVDGAGPLRRLVDITLPLIRPQLALSLMVTTIMTMGSFLVILVMTNGDPAFGTETLALFAFHRAIGVDFQIGYGAAISTVLLAINLLFAAAYLLWARER
jgi:multiple sugar transport system permease protein